MFMAVAFLNRAVVEIMLKYVAKPDKPQTVWRMHILCWIPKATIHT